ncbi:hypothetical protein PF010_g24126 [Phytophthora fragariae]|uniref:DUF1508 domain-containing protein n=1 Tax=Phytophthora fragariae TaxID=53985 RepID=A0A6G0K3H5_9STRA|nr:hypothetical protein PF003_g15369 [Phytophthora fragariae]KAE9075882.1 hypothetical protein PF010_g24126 [Phytophthora fragariae]
MSSVPKQCSSSQWHWRLVSNGGVETGDALQNHANLWMSAGKTEARSLEEVENAMKRRGNGGAADGAT